MRVRQESSGIFCKLKTSNDVKMMTVLGKCFFRWEFYDMKNQFLSNLLILLVFVG